MILILYMIISAAYAKQGTAIELFDDQLKSASCDEPYDL